MFKQLFRPKGDTDATNGTSATELGAKGTEASPHRHWELAAPPKERPGEKSAGEKLRFADAEGNRKPLTKPMPASEITGPGRSALESFEEIYKNAPVKPPQVTFSSLGILRVIDMVHSPHLDGMSTDGKRGAVLMALEIVGVKAEDLLQDAIVRQRALNVYEESQQTKLKDLETAKLKENTLIRAELDRLSAAHLARIQANLDELSRMQDSLRTWTER
jgi:hypothetical protein